MTVLDLLTLSFAELNVADASTALSSDDGAFALLILNDYLDALGTHGLAVYTTQRATWTITPNVTTYTIGIGATINVPRPLNPQAITSIGYINTALSPVQEISGLPVLTEGQFAAWPLKTMTGLTPTAFYYNPTFGSTGFGTITPLPVPTGASYQGVIYVPTPLTEFTALGNTVSLPAGYRRFLRLNLAVDLAGPYQVPLPEGLQERAKEARGDAKRGNERLTDMVLGGGGHYDINSDTYR